MEEREKIFNSFIGPIQDIMIDLYGSKELFLKTKKIHPIETSLVFFDSFIDDYDVAQASASAIGLELPKDADIDTYLIDRVRLCIKLERERGIPIRGYMEMSPSEYSKQGGNYKNYSRRVDILIASSTSS